MPSAASSADPPSPASPAPGPAAADEREAIRIAYAAHTDAGAFLLDAEGICRAFLPSPDQSGAYRVRGDAADRCVGAQYLAALDVTEPGALIALPRVGAALLLGRVDPESGRMSLVRTGPIVRYEVLSGARDSVSLPSTPSEAQVPIDWDEESTAAGPNPRLSAPLVTAMRPAAVAPDAEPTPVIALTALPPAAKSSGSLSEDPTHPTKSIRRAVPLGTSSGARMVEEIVADDDLGAIPEERTTASKIP